MRDAEFDREVRSRVDDVTCAQSTLEDFEAWFVGESWDRRTDLVATIDLLLAEKDLYSESELIDALQRCTSTVRLGDDASLESSNSTPVTLGSLDFTSTATIRRQLSFAGS